MVVWIGISVVDCFVRIVDYGIWLGILSLSSRK